LDRSRGRYVPIPDSRYRPRPQLAGVYYRAVAVFRSGLELRLCRRGREHRIPGGRQAPDSKRVVGRPACGWRLRKFRVAGRITVRAMPARVQPTSGDDRDGESESVSARLSLSGEWKLRVALS